ncbi:MAG: right-handed parallel beta-helix repeat-containing protein [Fimbriimonadales bacterium]|nr:right-handed parallel beta-helix repeat-containing protein [Fimbriimonadales bacterium]
MILGLLLLTVQSDVIRVADAESLRLAIARCKPGTEIVIAPGDYRTSVFAADIRGTSEKPIVIRGESQESPPEFVSWQLSRVEHLVLRDIEFRGSRTNGLNIDDGGTEGATRHVQIVRIKVSDLPQGNHDGIKLSGVQDFRVEDCTVERWGGSAIDMVGCQRGVIIDSTFRGGGDNAVQTKGGSADIRIVRCRIDQPGNRGVNIGGSTGRQYFRPQNANYEARNIAVEGCTFIGGMAAIAFVGVDGATVRYNTIYVPSRWAIRILQETTDPSFVQCRNGRFEHNLIAFRSDTWASGGVNIGPNTAPQAFQFSTNFWYCIDDPQRSRPQLPTPEHNGTYGIDPRFVAPETGNLNVETGSPARNVGSHAFKG